jgi:hypothetical protein
LVVLSVEVVVGTADQGVCFVEPFVNPGLVLGIAPFDEGCEPFRYKLELAAKVFD